jgi:hypothetical protein
VNAYDDTLDGIWDCVIVKLNATGHVLFSTFYGGSGIEYASAVALDDTGQIYVSGLMRGGNFSIINVQNQVFNGTYGLFVLVMNPIGTEITFSGVLKDSAQDGVITTTVQLIALSEEEVWMCGGTEYLQFPCTENAFDQTIKKKEGFILMIDPVICSLNYSSFFGGSDRDYIAGLSVNDQGDIAGAGFTESLDIATLNALEPDKIGSQYDQDGFAFRFEINDTVTTTSPTTPSTGILELVFIAVAGGGITLVLIIGAIVITRKS